MAFVRSALGRIVIRRIAVWRMAIACALFAQPLSASSLEEREINVGGKLVRYTLSVPDPAAPLEKTESAGPIATARRMHEHLARGEIEEAALLSNSPKRRYEVYRDYLGSVGADGFRKVFSQYLVPANAVLAEIVIGRQSLLIWKLRDLPQPAGEFFIEVDGQTYMDDVPSETRQQLRRILEEYRAGRK